MDQWFNLLVVIISAVILRFLAKGFVESMCPMWPVYNQRLQDIAERWKCAHQQDNGSVCEKTFQDLSDLCRQAVAEDRHGTQLILLLIIKSHFGSETVKMFLDEQRRRNREEGASVRGKS